MARLNRQASLPKVYEACRAAESKFVILAHLDHIGRIHDTAFNHPDRLHLLHPFVSVRRMLSKTTPKAHSRRIMTKSATADSVVQICCVCLCCLSPSPSQQSPANNSSSIYLEKTSRSCPILNMQPARASMFRKRNMACPFTPHFKATTQTHARTHASKLQRTKGTLE